MDCGVTGEGDFEMRGDWSGERDAIHVVNAIGMYMKHVWYIIWYIIWYMSKYTSLE